VTTGQQLRKFVPSDGSAHNQFGYTVSISGNLAVIGAPYSTVRGHLDAGAAYVFDATTGAQLAKLTANDAADVDEFGYVSISGGLVLVGSILDDLNGSAYLFDASTGTQLRKFTAFDAVPGSNAHFGYSVAISNGISVVGAWGQNSRAGAAYVFVPEPAGNIAAALGMVLISSATRRQRIA
jgi:outer membrane protein assembly factor BamB